MAHVWTPSDLDGWRKLTREARRVLADRGKDHWRAGSLADLRRVAAATQKKCFPTHDPMDQSRLNAFLQVCDEFASGTHADRLALAAALQRGIEQASRILTMGGDPGPTAPAAQAAAGGARQMRLPYADD